MSTSSISVVQYNVLSSKYCTTDMYVKCPPYACDEEYRMKKLRGQLTAFTDNNAIICLQEVCYTFRVKLEVFFAERGYRFVATNYGGPWSGSMGTAIAYPETFILRRCQFVRIADIYQSFVPEKVHQSTVPTPSLLSNLWWWSGLGTDPNSKSPKQLEQDILAKFDSEMRKTNAIQILLELCPPEESSGTSGRSFVISTYHTPCKFWDDHLMLLLTAIPMHNVFTFLENVEGACVLAGDFNILPTSDTYKLYTSGLDTFDTDRYNPIVRQILPRLKLLQMKSAAVEVKGNEPSNTTHCSTVRNGNPKDFCETIDYIFTSSLVKVKEFDTFPEIQKPSSEDNVVIEPEYLPNADHPSDHRILYSEILY